MAGPGQRPRAGLHGTPPHRHRVGLLAASRSGEEGFFEYGGLPGYEVQPLEERDAAAAYVGDQAAIALELAEARRDARQIGLLEDRDRIAEDLHDVVIQRLFATAMTLMSTFRLMERQEAAKRVQHAIDELDETIRQIRSTILALQGPPAESTPSLRSRIVELVEGAGTHLGSVPGLRMEGQIDTLVPEPTADHLLATLCEALTNVVRHSRSSRAAAAEVAGAELILTVTDNGVGVGHGERRSGLRNIEDRAGRLGGTAQLETPNGGGTATLACFLANLTCRLSTAASRPQVIVGEVTAALVHDASYLDQQETGRPGCPTAVGPRLWLAQLFRDQRSEYACRSVPELQADG
ncbi:hypothetical protein GCM10010149_59430 [Nonomuraea roseoviolacea subsp. roseoviolacea]|uniref:sensor histidine kinase n=1 Tax=Nonomuraea roseoviolacea TaxID=103837 RepID=UPI0031DB73EF